MTATGSQAQVPSVGSWVQVNPSAQNLLAPKPTPSELTIGLVRQLFSAEGQQYYQVVWNPGSAFPETGLYTVDQLCTLTDQAVNQIMCQLNEGTYTPPSVPANPITGAT